MGINYFHIPVRDDLEEEIKNLISDLKKRGYNKPNYSQVVALLLEKNKKFKLTDKDLDMIIRRFM
jgi:hypothetical protein